MFADSPCLCCNSPWVRQIMYILLLKSVTKFFIPVSEVNRIVLIWNKSKSLQRVCRFICEVLWAENLLQSDAVAFPWRWLIQVQWTGKGGIRLWAVFLNHTVLPHRRHLSPNTKGFRPQGTLDFGPSAYSLSIQKRVEPNHIHLFYATERGKLPEPKRMPRKILEPFHFSSLQQGHILNKIQHQPSFCSCR